MKKTFFVFLFLAVLDMCVIFAFSSQNSEQSTNISKEIANNIVSDISSETETAKNTEEQFLDFDYIHYLLRKSAHVFLYTLLGVLTVSAVHLSGKIKSKIKVFLISLFICVGYAVTDEIHQFFVPGRSCEFKDVLIDSSGIMFGLLIFFVFEICTSLKQKN